MIRMVIPVSLETRDKLKECERKKEIYDQVMQRLLEELKQKIK
jgi:hypothetical protein